MLTPSCAPAWLTSFPASTALSAVCLAFSERFAMVADISCTELACSVAPWASAWALPDTCSEREDTCSALVAICPIVLFSPFWMLSNDCLMDRKSPL